MMFHKNAYNKLKKLLNKMELGSASYVLHNSVGARIVSAVVEADTLVLCSTR